jgi:hypothetical protein
MVGHHHFGRGVGQLLAHGVELGLGLGTQLWRRR